MLHLVLGCFSQGEGANDVATNACYIYFLRAFYKERVLSMLQHMHATSIFGMLFTRRGCYRCYNRCKLHLIFGCFSQGENVSDVATNACYIYLFFGCFSQGESVSDDVATDACYIYFLGAFYKERVLSMLQQRMHATSIVKQAITAGEGSFKQRVFFPGTVPSPFPICFLWERSGTWLFPTPL